MKKLLLVIATLAAVAGMVDMQAAAAQDRQKSHEMSIRVGNYDVWLETARMKRTKKGRYEGRIGTMEVGFNGFRALAGAYDNYLDDEKGFMDLRMGRSFHVTFNVWTFSARLTRSNVLGVTGAIGMACNNYRFEQLNTFVKERNVLHPVAGGPDIRKSKLTTFALHFPLALEVNPARNFFFSVGGYVDLMTGAHMKWKAPKDKLRRLGTQNFLHAGATARIGFKHAYVFGSYDFVRLFKAGRGPALNPYTFGMGFGF
jgi:Ni/Co efflux regulator RcnB